MKPSICTHIEIRGIVQGVGFRPFLHRLAESCHITGWVRNTSDGVEGLLKGSEEALARFEERIRKDAPPLARVEELKLSPMDATFGFDRFTIEESFAGPGSTLVSPDISICPECAAELYDPSDRRYRYPFINCTHCGPRYTIITSLPYDRKRTVMDDFPMCDDCAREYGDIRDRRYHAQPDCCPVCGPKAFFADKNGQTVDADPFYESQKLLRSGGILAVKGVGGVHLACDAMDPRAVLRLREQKNRPISGSIQMPKSSPMSFILLINDFKPLGNFVLSTVQSPSPALSFTRPLNQPSSMTKTSTPISFAIFAKAS